MVAAPVVVIGAGLGGLSAALHLAGAGRDVLVVEADSQPGGLAGRHQVAGYTFDTGPSVLTMPEIIADVFGAVGEDMASWLELIPLDPVYRGQFADGSTLDVHSDVEVMAAQLATECSAGDAEGYRRYVAHLRQLFELEMHTFIDRDVSRIRSLLRPELIALLRIGAFGKLADHVGNYVHDERLRRLFSFQALYAGLAPADALALYAVIGYMDAVNGVYAPRTGMHALPLALTECAEKHGVSFRMNTRAEQVLADTDGACAVRLAGGEVVAASAVVINSDLPSAYEQLLPGPTPRRVRQLRYAPSCVVLHLGTHARAADWIRHHTISFGAAWEQTFDEIIRQGRTMSDPSVLVSTPSITDTTLAPPGGSSHFVLFPTPNLAHAQPLDWQRLAEHYRDKMVMTLQERGFGIEANAIEHELLVTPADWEARGLSAGTPFAAAHTFRQTGPFRSAMRHPRLSNVVFCGSHTQPGVGVPMVLISGRLAAAALLESD